MSNREEGAKSVKEDGIPSTEEIINDVVESCEKLKVNDGVSHSVDDTVDNNENKNENENDEDYVDVVYLKDLDMSSSSNELEERKKDAMKKKELGNDLFKTGEFELARKKYTEALRSCPLKFSEERAVLYANRAAAKLKDNHKDEAIKDCTKAIELNPEYVKAYLRRAKLYEELDKLDEALEDYKKIVEMDSGCTEARIATMRLPSQINERNEKLKAEMLGSLKELGNKILKPFGLSTDNFQVQQDPKSGGYSINFTQNPK